MLHARRLCPQLLNLPGRDLCVRLMGLRTALPGTDVPVLVRRRPQLLLDEVRPRVCMTSVQHHTVGATSTWTFGTDIRSVTCASVKS